MKTNKLKKNKSISVLLIIIGIIMLSWTTFYWGVDSVGKTIPPFDCSVYPVIDNPLFSTGFGLPIIISLVIIVVGLYLILK